MEVSERDTSKTRRVVCAVEKTTASASSVACTYVTSVRRRSTQT
nr:hypothetical protein [Haloquadratum walsbyi]